MKACVVCGKTVCPVLMGVLMPAGNSEWDNEIGNRTNCLQ